MAMWGWEGDTLVTQRPGGCEYSLATEVEAISVDLPRRGRHGIGTHQSAAVPLRSAGPREGFCR